LPRKYEREISLSRQVRWTENVWLLQLHAEEVSRTETDSLNSRQRGQADRTMATPKHLCDISPITQILVPQNMTNQSAYFVSRKEIL